MGYYDDHPTSKEKEIDRRAAHSLQAIRQRHQDKAAADHEKTQAALKLAREKAEEARERDRLNHRRKENLQNAATDARLMERELLLQHRADESEISRQFRIQEQEAKNEQSAALTVARAEASWNWNNSGTNSGKPNAARISRITGCAPNWIF